MKIIDIDKDLARELEQQFENAEDDKARRDLFQYTITKHLYQKLYNAYLRNGKQLDRKEINLR